MRNLYLLLCILFNCLLHAQQYEKLNGPYGGGSKVYEGNAGVLFLFPEGQTYYYKSIDGGSNWRSFSYPKPAINHQVSLGADGHLLFLANDDLYRSSNDGQSWSKVNLPTGEVTYKAQSLGDGSIVISTLSGVYFSQNNGASWNLSDLLSGVSHFFNSKNDHWVYGMNSRYVYLSKNSGMSWDTLFGTLFNGLRFNVLENHQSEIFISAQDYIWKVDTLGNFLLRTTIQQNTGSTVDMAITASGKIYASENGIVYVSNNGGAVWNSTSSNIVLEFIAGINAQGNLFGVSYSSSSIYTSSDGGKNWIFSAYGILSAAIVEVDFISNQEIVVLTNDGLFYSKNDGKTWSLIHQSSGAYSSSQSGKIQVIDDDIFLILRDGIYHFSNPEAVPVKRTIPGNGKPFYRLGLNSSSKSLFLFNDGEFYKSSDNAQSWQRMSLPGVANFYTFPNGEMISFYDNRIYKSNDDGMSWVPVLNDVPNLETVENIAGDGFHSAWFLVFIANDVYLYETNDNGSSWKRKLLGSLNNWLASSGFLVSNNIGTIFSFNQLEDIYSLTANTNGFKIFDRLDNVLTGSIVSLAISPNQKLYVGTSIDGLFRFIIPTSSNKIIKGRVFEDSNRNCKLDVGESHFEKVLVKGKLQSGGEFVSYANQGGYFYMPLFNEVMEISAVANHHYLFSCVQTINGSTYNTNDELALGVYISVACPYLEVDIQSGGLRRCFENDLVVNYYNSGTKLASDAYIEVQLDTFMEYRSSSIPLVTQSGRTLRFDLGDLEIFQGGNFTIRVALSCDAKLGDVHCLEAHIYPDSLCVPGTFAKIRTHAECLGDSIRLIIRNVGNGAMSAAKNWWVADVTQLSSKLDVFDSGTFFLDAGQEFSKTILSRGRVIFSAEQDDLYPSSQSSTTEIISCALNPAPGLPPLRITNLDEEEPYISKFCLQNRGSFDPNDITGFPQGLTDKKYIDAEQELEYLIRFQNTGTDTAFTVRIENQIRKEQLDLATFIPGASSHPYSYLITPEGKLIFSFSNIQLPDSNINEKASHGFVQYRIRPVQKLLKGTKVYNDASIYFDFNDGVSTNVEFHTLGFPVPVNDQNVNRQSYGELLLNPNPATSEVEIKWKDKQTAGFYYLHIYNELFQKIEERKLWSLSRPIDITNLHGGIYYLVLQSETGEMLGTGKLIRK